MRLLSSSRALYARTEQYHVLSVFSLAIEEGNTISRAIAPRVRKNVEGERICYFIYIYTIYKIRISQDASAKQDGRLELT